MAKNFAPKSFATRLSMYIISLMVIIFGTILWLFYTDTKERITERAIVHTDLVLNEMSTKITLQLNEVQTALRNIAWVLQDKNIRTDSLSSILTSIVANNPLIVGSSIAFSKKFKMLYASRKRDTILCQSLKEDTYQYANTDWFSRPILTKESYWSEPYFDKGGRNIFMCTFSYPLVNPNGNVYAVITAEISLDKFSSDVEKLKPYKDGASFLISRNNLFLTNYETDKIASQTVRLDVIKQNFPKYEHAIDELINNTIQSLYIKELDSYIFHMLIPGADWAIWSICPQSAMTDALNKHLYIIILLTFVGIITLFSASYFAIKRLAKPLHSFAQSAKEIATGRFDVQLPYIKSQDEMLDLRKAFDYMQLSLSKYIEDLQITTAIKNRMENELIIAREIQYGLLPQKFPPYPERTDIDIHALLKPAREVGGDLYGFMIEDNKLFMFIGDVSGKGIPAALFMAISHSVLKTIIKPDLSAEKIVFQLNNAIVSLNDSGMFVTLFLGILDLETGKFNFCNAGHNPPIIISPNGEAFFLEVKTNIAIGLVDKFEFIGQNITFENGYKLALYTDGIIEAKNKENVLYSNKKLLEVLQNTQYSNTKAIVEIMANSVASHVKETPQSDDIAILVIGYNANYCKEITLKNDLAQITHLELFVQELTELFHFSDKEAMNLRLVLEEMVVNVIMYGYEPGDTDQILIKVSKTSKELIINIFDHGKPFDPTIVIEPDINLSIEERPIGGLGIYLVRNLMDQIIYERIDNRNHLIIKKITN